MTTTPRRDVTDDPTDAGAPRRAGRDPEGTRRRILDAALAEFSRKGIAGARVDAIAERAGTNKRMIYHYFSSKEGLYRAVLHEGLSRQPASDADQEHRLLRLHDRFAQNPDWVRLLMWEALERSEGGPLANAELRGDGMRRLVETVAADLRSGDGDPDEDAIQTALTELAITMFPFAFGQFVELAAGTTASNRSFQRARRAHLTRLAARSER